MRERRSGFLALIVDQDQSSEDCSHHLRRIDVVPVVLFVHFYFSVKFFIIYFDSVVAQ